jgi:monomeric sarcosine oxidase
MTYDAVVIGGGVNGMAAAYALLLRGVGRVLVLERYTVGHDRAASTDATKAIRYEYAEQALYSQMVGRSIALWRDLEAATGDDLYVNCGVVCWGRGDESFAQRSYETLKTMGSPIRELSPDELCEIFPQFSVADMSYATYNTEGGFLRASSCVAVFAREVIRLGGEIRENAGVTAFEETAAGVRLRLDTGEDILTHRALFAAGAWGASLFPRMGFPLPMTANKQQVVYLEGLGAEFAPGRFPVFLNLDHDFYGFPLDAFGRLKAAVHEPGPVIDPDVPQSPDEEATALIVTLLERYIPGVIREGRVSLARTCMYAMTPDEDFIIDRFPGSRNVVFAAGFSGHGFKFAPVTGRLLAALSLDEQPEFPLNPFSLARFSNPA